ncbi:MAG: hypothetical protein ABSE39_13640 [Candidatus Bathyarchaeia archaeon]
MTTVDELLMKILDSDIKADLLTLFYKSPGVIDTMDGVAWRIGLQGKDIENDVKELVEIGLLKVKRFSKNEVIFFQRSRDMEVQQILSDRFKEPT